MQFVFWPVEESAVLADGPTGCGEVARGGCCNFSVTRSTVLTAAKRRARTNTTFSLH